MPHAGGDDTVIRLVKLSSDVLPSLQTVAMVDGSHEGITIGRDRSFTPRLRLPSMEISKHHARIFTIARKRHSEISPCFFITDTGSTHGTHIYRPEEDEPQPMHPSSVHRIPRDAFQRLSAERNASTPLILQHLDLIRFGLQSNIFEVHMHGSAWASCPECQICPDGSNEIPLAPTASAAKYSENPAKHLVGPAKTKGDKRRAHQESRQHLKLLKEAYVSPALGSNASPAMATRYRDRASARRERFSEIAQARMPTKELDTTRSVVSHPIDASNIGYRMLATMANGAEHIPDQMPIAPKVSSQRAGLGSEAITESTEYLDYQDHARTITQRRFTNM
ncbi:hypothetical protein MPSI1_001736 [Malassezia psittaci]|uniref:FHA domain-containing protein n=1 Tax=Malassezia psittaci TaxID=1821823 RepID=A0AAF0F5B9_9BASI|nr:hypothetical protein MPSI1_001736 [Malassezia psittaci]